MTSENWDHELFELMQEEHKELTELLVRVRSAMSADNRTKKEVDDLMARLRDLVETHFSHEEQGGYMTEVLQRAPRFTTQVSALLDQHELLLDDVEKLRLLARSGVESAAFWTRIQADFNDFAAQLLRHEHTETKVLQGAYTDDIGTGD